MMTMRTALVRRGTTSGSRHTGGPVVGHSLRPDYVYQVATKTRALSLLLHTPTLGAVEEHSFLLPPYYLKSLICDL